jgi:hypothetical protein
MSELKYVSELMAWKESSKSNKFFADYKNDFSVKKFHIM